MGSIGSNEKIFTCPYCHTKIRKVVKTRNPILICPVCKKDFEGEVRSNVTNREDYGPNKIICTWILFAINVLLYVCNMNSDTYVVDGGANYTYIIEYGEYYRIFTSMFLHLGAMHIIMNMFALLVLGRELESKLGSLKLILIYLGSGIGSALFSIYIHYTLEPEVLNYSVGASGAIFGLMVAELFLKTKEQGDGLLVALITSIICVIVYAIITWSIGVDLYGHIGGAITGGIITSFLTIGYTTPKKQNVVITFLAIIITIFLSLLGMSSTFDNEIIKIGNRVEDIVKCSHPTDTPTITYGDAFDEFFANESWNTFLSTDGETIVEFKGTCMDGKNIVTMQFQFTLDLERKTFEATYMSIDGKSQTKQFLYTVIERIFDHYKTKHDY